MTDHNHPSPPAKRWRSVVAVAVSVVVIATVVCVLHGPAVTMALTGDSYQWIQHAHRAAHEPALLVADLDTFYRPSTTWSLVMDRVLWGGFEARGYRTTSLALHGLVAMALVVAGRRLGLGWIAAAMVGVIWVSSPFTDESAFVVAYRFQPLLLLAWLVLIAVWPAGEESWSRSRIIVAAVAVLAAAAAKETWVVTPALVAALEFGRQKTARAALAAAAVVVGAVVAYLAVYFAVFPTAKTYYELGPHALARIPAQLAAFFYLEEPVTQGFALTFASSLAALAVAAVVVSCLRWRVDGSLVALALLVLPTLPTLLVPYMPQRYLAIPYTGFLLLIAFWLAEAGRRMKTRRGWLRAAVFIVVVLVVVAGGAVVRADLRDYRALADAHAVLLREAEQVVDPVFSGGPVLVVRDEQTTPLLSVVQRPEGLPKLVFIRNHDPYGLIDSAALFEWVRADEGVFVQHIKDWPEICRGVEGVVVAHGDGVFVDLGTTPDLAREAERWRSSGRGLQVVRTAPLD